MRSSTAPTIQPANVVRRSAAITNTAHGVRLPDQAPPTEEEESPATPQSWVDKVLLPISQRPSAHVTKYTRPSPGKFDLKKLTENRGPEPKRRDKQKKGAEMELDLLKPVR